MHDYVKLGPSSKYLSFDVDPYGMDDSLLISIREPSSGREIVSSPSIPRRGCVAKFDISGLHERICREWVDLVILKNCCECKTYRGRYTGSCSASNPSVEETTYDVRDL